MKTVKTSSEHTTEGIRVRVESRHIQEQSTNGEWVFAYAVRIENRGNETVTLRRRRWHIEDQTGEITLVEGAGVIGVEPTLRAGESFEYESGTPLATPMGLMYGAYRFEGTGGRVFEADIAPFALVADSALN